MDKKLEKIAKELEYTLLATYKHLKKLELKSKVIQISVSRTEPSIWRIKT